MIAFKTISLLIISNFFMTIAWYGHLKFKNKMIWLVIFLSWAIAFFEYCFQVPANRIGHSIFTAPQLKMLQEVITFSVFAIFSIFYLNEKPTIYDYIAYFLVFIAILVSLLQPR